MVLDINKMAPTRVTPSVQAVIPAEAAIQKNVIPAEAGIHTAL